MSRSDLVRDIERAIGRLERAYRGHADESDLYEASLLALCVDAAEAAGGTALLTDDGRTRAGVLRFRRSPGNLWRDGFTYALVEFPRTAKRLEIHLGVYVVGQSRVPHECDVALVEHQEAERSRQARVHPRREKLVAAIEAKHYSAPPGLGVGRAFHGLAHELGEKRCSLVYPARESRTVAMLLAARPSEQYGELLPGRPAADRLRAHMEQAIRNWRHRS